MKLPPLQMPAAEWVPGVLERWTVLVEKVARMKAATGKTDAFERMLAVLRDMASTGRFDGLPGLLKKRITARALTWLWLEDEVMASRLLNPRMLSALLEAQKPRLTRISLQQLAQLYFRRFDKLDVREELRELLEQSLRQQLEAMPAPRITGPWTDPLVTLKRESHWLLGLEGPARLVEKVRSEGRELGATFSEMGLQGFDDGRYADLCRAHFYLETLRQLPIGESDPVLDELLKPSVAKAPFEGDRRIGHVALEILIDRAGQEPGEVWQNFILDLAGDPRIARNSPNYREWWQQLGEERIQKVRGWLSKEDLRLFLQAVEQFGIETQNGDLQRMFPARKLFLEGLFRLKLIRNTRLLLGGKARQSVKRILGEEVKTSFASMDGPMNDKAVIYLDCGDFHLVEGSHSFKIWVYLAAPGELLRSYERSSFSHFDLTSNIPGAYERLYPGLPYDAFVHTPHLWQSKVFNFLAENGIELDMEQLLSREDYRLQLQKYGIPVVSPHRTQVPAPSTTADVTAPSRVQAPTAGPRSTGAAAQSGTSRRATAGSVVDKTYGGARPGPEAGHAGPRLASLKPAELNVLRYFRDNPGDRVRYAANVLGVEARDINQILYGPLKGMLVQDAEFGWRLSEKMDRELDAFDQTERDV